MRQLGEQRAEGVGIEIVHEMQARGRAQRADARHRVAGKLHQRLAAQAGTAGAEEDDVGGVFGQPAAGLPDRHQIVMGFRQPQQRQAAIGVARAQAFERGVGAIERGVQGLVGNAVRPDAFFERAVDGLDQGHGGTLMTVIVRASGRSSTRRRSNPARRINATAVITGCPAFAGHDKPVGGAPRAAQPFTRARRSRSAPWAGRRP